MPNVIASDTPFVAANDRERKKRIGSIGAAARSSHATNATSMTTPATIEPTTSGEPQPAGLPRTIPYTTPSRPSVPRASPGRSRLLAGPWLSARRRAASGTSARPTGTLSQKIQCQEMPSITAPPTSGPSATPRPLTPDQTPSASPRRSAGTAELRIVRLSGATMPAPRPCTARAAISAPVLGASAAAADATVKIDSPMMNMRLRPKRSPSAAPVSRNTANASV